MQNQNNNKKHGPPGISNLLIISIFLMIFGAQEMSLAQLTFLPPVGININQSGRKEARLFLPSNYVAMKKIPLIVLLHGFSSSGRGIEGYIDLTENAALTTALPPFAILIPEGSIDRHGRQFWNATAACCDRDHTNVNDAAYLSTLLAQIQTKYPALTGGKIFLIGHSNGGFMAHRLACESPLKIDGIVSISGGTFLRDQECRNPRPLVYLQIHATEDPTVKYRQSSTLAYRGGVGSIEMMLHRNLCTREESNLPSLDLVPSLAGSESTVKSWNRCLNSYRVQLVSVNGKANSDFSPHVPGFDKIKIKEVILNFLLK